MSIASEVSRISQNVQNTISVIQQTGVSVPENPTSDDLPSLAEALANEKQNKVKFYTVTLSTTGWSDNTQTVSVSGILADETAQQITAMPAAASQAAYYAAGVYASGQGAGTLTFTCTTTPTEDLTVYVTVMEVTAG